MPICPIRRSWFRGNKMPFPGIEDRERAQGRHRLSCVGPARRRRLRPAAPPHAAARGRASQHRPHRRRQPASSYVPGLRYTLRTGIAEGRMVFIGVGGTIDGQVNPVLSAAEGQVVQVTLINGEGAEHDIVFADQEATARSPHITGKGASTNIAFRAGKAGDYIYFCSVPGHQLAGMRGQFLVTPQAPPQTLVEADISQNVDRSAAADRQAGAADRPRRSRRRGTGRPPRRRHDLRLLDLQRQSAGTVPARSRRRHRRRPPEEFQPTAR